MKKVIAYFQTEKEITNKSDLTLKKEYKQRIKDNLEGEREAIVFIVDKLGEAFYSKKLNKEYQEKLTYGFEQLIGKKELWNSINKHIDFRKDNLK